MLLLLLLYLYLYKRVGVILVEIGRAQGHLWLLEYVLLGMLLYTASILMVLHEQVPMLSLSVSTVHFLL